MRIIDLSHTLVTGMTVYPGDEIVPEVRHVSEHGGGDHQSSAVSMGCHAGTHVDLPLHFRPGESGLEDFPLARCAGPALAVDAPAGAIGPEVLDGLDLAGIDHLVLRTGWERHWGTPRYYEGWPHLTPTAARRLAAAGLRGIGLDSPSVDPFGGHEAHEILAAAGMINLENLARLDDLPAGRFTLLALPLKLAGAEASPVRAAALVAAGGERGA